MIAYKHVYEMVELHDNNKLKVILNNEEFEPHKDTAFSNTLLYASVYCNNYDAYLMLINHKKIKTNYYYNNKLFDIIFRKYLNNNTFYFDEFMKTNNTINYNIIRLCDSLNIDIMKKIINHIDFNNHSLNEKLTYLLSMIGKNDIKLYVLKFFLDNNPLTINFSNIIVENIIYFGNVELLKFVKDYGIDIKIQNNIPTVIYILKSYNRQAFLDYYISENYYYNQNLLNKNIIYTNDYYMCPLCIEYLIDNFDIFSKMFSSSNDDNNELLNEFINTICFENNVYWRFHHSIFKNDIYNLIKPIVKKIFNFLIKRRTNNNLIHHSFFVRLLNDDISNLEYNKDCAKIFLTCLVENNFIPNENYQKLINEII